MQRSTDRILTTHAGSLVRPPEIIEAARAIDLKEPYDEKAFQEHLRQAVAAVVRKQVAVGIDVPDDGEFGKHAWIGYVTERLAGLETRPADTAFAGRPRGLVTESARQRFAGFYSIYLTFEYNLWLSRTVQGTAPPLATPTTWVCTGPISYKGQAAIQRDMANLKAALAGLRGRGCWRWTGPAGRRMVGPTGAEGGPGPVSLALESRTHLSASAGVVKAPAYGSCALPLPMREGMAEVFGEG